MIWTPITSRCWQFGKEKKVGLVSFWSKGQFEKKNSVWLFLIGTLLFSACTSSIPETYREAYAQLPEKIDYNFHVKPILSDRCYACHGPDEQSREADLRLDTEEGAFEALKESDNFEFAIKKGSLEKSAIWHRISTMEEDLIMPPPNSNLTLSNTEIATLAKWIQQGAEWKQHWSFIPPEKSKSPKVKNKKWPQNSIDHFILNQLEQHQIEPSEKADEVVLLRRLSLDLTGLPPTLERIEQFIQDQAPDKLEKYIDELLASPQYGERMAVDWLDLARYADTHGYQADRYRNTWQWRDWVVKAFNENMPYDQFITWQLAGDLLPNASFEQKLATAFNRNHMQTEEGGSVEEEFRVEYVADRTNTFGAAFLGMTLECARCHDHKYDPISTKEYYELFAFFNTIDESGQTSHFTDAIPVPTLLLTSERSDSIIQFLNQKVASTETLVSKQKEQSRQVFNDLRTVQLKKLKPELTKDLLGDFSFDRLRNQKITNNASFDVAVKFREDWKLVSGKSGKAIQVDGEIPMDFGELGDFSRADPFTIGLWVQPTLAREKSVIIHRSRASLDAGSRGYELVLEGNKVSASLNHMHPHNALKVISHTEIPLNEWTHLAMTYDGSSKANGLKLFINGQEAKVDVLKDNLYKDIRYERVPVSLQVGARFRDPGFAEGMVDELKVYSRALTNLEIDAWVGGDRLTKLLSKNGLSEEEKEELFELYLSLQDQDFQRESQNLTELRLALNQAVDTVEEIMVMKEILGGRKTFILDRGAYDAPAEEVFPATPVSILPMAEKYPSNRQGLAQWLVDPENPLTARVMVNRIWQQFLGIGLVATPEDFGSQGTLPLHPELLDYLAVDFVESGWDIKALVKSIVSSSTYQQASDVREELLEIDPENLFLARGPSVRLSAEMVRDHALMSAGLLNPEMGGIPVRPYQPEGLWKEKSGATYVPSKGKDLYRRSLYTYWKRTSPPPSMMIFDASARNNCVVKRQMTHTPLQALVLMNDPQFVEASRKLAERMLKEGGNTLETQITYGFSLLCARKPNASELQILLDTYDEQLALFDEKAALGLLQTGDSPYDENLDIKALSSMSIVANTMMNYDAFYVKK